MFSLVSAACLILGASPVSGLADASPFLGARPEVALLQQGSAETGSAAAAVPSEPSTGESATAYFEFLRGRHLESLGRAADALEAYERAAKAHPRSAEIRAEVAALHARQNRPDEAIANANAALKLDAANPEAHWVLGTVYAALAEAREEERASRPVRPGSADPTPERTGDVPSPDVIVGHLEKARPSRLYDNSLHLTLARLYLDQKEWSKAIDVAFYVVEREPGAVDAAYMLAQAYEGAGRYDEAIAAIEDAVAVDPESPRALAYLGELYGRVRKWDEAAGAFERAAVQRPGVLDLRLRQAGALVSGGRAAAARDLLRQLAETQPKEARVLYLLAEVERSLKDLTAAEATARKLIALSPKQPFGYHALAQVHAQRHDNQKVIETLSPIVESADLTTAGARVYAPLYVALGYAYQELGNFDKAIAAFERARQAGGDDVAYQAYLVQAHLAAGRTERAVELAAAVRQTQPTNLRLMNLEAQARLQHGETGKAIEILEQAVETYPNDVQAHVALAGVFSEAKQFARAEDVLTRAGVKFPSDITVPFQLGAVFDEQKRHADAERAFRRALAIDPLHAPSLNYLGYMLAEGGQRLDEAVKLIAQAIEIDPHNGSYLDSLGWAYYKQGKLEKAREYLVKAGAQMPVNSVVQDHVGDVLFALRDVDGAVAAWQRALNGDGRSIDRATIEKKIAQARKK
jgi:tetratricopeptide (TPR) repeat protein